MSVCVVRFLPPKWNAGSACESNTFIDAMSLPPATKLRQGNVFTPVCHSVHGVGVSVPACTTGHMTRGSLSGGVSVQMGGSVQGGLLGRTPRPSMATSEWYISYWNAFLYIHFFHFTQVADPGFPRVGVPALRGSANIRFCQIFPKTSWNWKNLDRSLAPPPIDPPLYHVVVLSLLEM